MTGSTTVDNAGRAKRDSSNPPPPSVAEASLPSIIVADDARVDAPPSVGDLSETEAEQFAAAFRPSWHSQLPAAPAPVAAETTATTAKAPATGVDAGSRDAEEEAAAAVASIAGGRMRRRAAIAIGGLTLGFAALVALGIGSSTGEPAPGASAATEIDTASDGDPEAHTPAAPEMEPAALAATPQADPTQADPTQAEPTAETSAALAENTSGTDPVVDTPPGEDAAGETAPGLEIAADDSAPQTAEAVEPSERAAEPEPAPLPEPSVEQAPAQVEVRVAASPKRARLRVGGKPVGNPYQDALPSGGDLEIEASAPGYVSRTMTVNLDRDRTLALTLERKAKVRRKAKSKRPRQQAKSTPRKTEAPASEGAGFVSESPY